MQRLHALSQAIVEPKIELMEVRLKVRKGRWQWEFDLVKQSIRCRRLVKPIRFTPAMAARTYFDRMGTAAAKAGKTVSPLLMGQNALQDSSLPKLFMNSMIVSVFPIVTLI